MTEYTYDPEFPYLVLFGEYVAAKFPADESGKANANSYAREGVGTVIDTTPKPKIPEDAEYIMWPTEWGLNFANKKGGFWDCGGAEVSVQELLFMVGDAEVTVLVPKEVP